MDIIRLAEINKELLDMGRDEFAKLPDSEKLQMASEVMADALESILDMEREIEGMRSGLYAACETLRILLPFVREQEMTAEVANAVEYADLFIMGTDILRALEDRK